MTGLDEMADNSSRPIRFRDYLPEVLRGDERDAGSFQNRFLRAFEDLFEELQSIIEGVSPGDLGLTVDSVLPAEPGSQKIEIKVTSPFEAPPKFPADTFVTLPGNDADPTTLAEDYPGLTGAASLFVRDAAMRGCRVSQRLRPILPPGSCDQAARIRSPQRNFCPVAPTCEFIYNLEGRCHTAVRGDRSVAKALDPTSLPIRDAIGISARTSEILRHRR